MSRRPRLYIAYGLCEGPRIGATFEAALKAAGFVIVRGPTGADVIVAHSGGCFVLPAAAIGTPAVFIGLPYVFHASLLKAFCANIWRGFRGHASQRSTARWLYETLWNLIYAWNLRYNWQMLRGMRSANWRAFQNVTLICNRHDAICVPDFKRLPLAPNTIGINIAGEHSDCWDNPAPYVALIKRAAYG